MTDRRNETYRRLATLAEEARQKSYCPYSGKSVGAALLCEDGKIYTGENIENASFTPTVCAERVAFFRALHDGERHFRAIAIAGGDRDVPALAPFPPCGVCRQVMAEFCDGDFIIILVGQESEIHTLDEMLPYRFTTRHAGKR